MLYNSDGCHIDSEAICFRLGEPRRTQHKEEVGQDGTNLQAHVIDVTTPKHNLQVALDASHPVSHSLPCSFCNTVLAHGVKVRTVRCAADGSFRLADSVRVSFEARSTHHNVIDMEQPKSWIELGALTRDSRTTENRPLLSAASDRMSSTTFPNVALSKPPTVSPKRSAKSSVTSPSIRAKGTRAKKFCIRLPIDQHDLLSTST